MREPRHAPHATGVRLVDRALRRASPDSDWQVDVGLPLALDDTSEPDVSVVAGGPRDYLTAHPARPVLVVEVSESSLGFDQRDKASVYARASLADYWIVNLADRPPGSAPRIWIIGAAIGASLTCCPERSPRPPAPSPRVW